MKSIVSFAGSISKNSINKQLVNYAGQFVNIGQVKLLDLNDYELPLFGVDLQNEKGIPDNAYRFLKEIQSADGIILSLAEHNGAYTTAFKNIFDWMSRIDGKLWNEIPMLLMATSPGRRGGASVLQIAKNRFPYMGGNIVAEFCLPSFNENFKGGKIIDKELNTALKISIETFKEAI
ncbi:NADPH-dependent FMN reductase [Mangrovimonas aestuarii]|uniref:NADPH-dependent FMN reductase n=1 Tax=Mangrovimonas aestuarii TaxID=3018443 RepID=UPI002377F6F3|nr:NAD(P)H-dependent oxidoreductase [Mangrovimonas aestuarii]